VISVDLSKLSEAISISKPTPDRARRASKLFPVSHPGERFSRGVAQNRMEHNVYYVKYVAVSIVKALPLAV
jgi:hypothetical protein